MLKCIAKCSKGFDRCCFNCQLKDLCEESCGTDNPEECSLHIHSEEVRAKKRTSEMDKRFWRIYIILFVLTLIILVASLVIISNQNAQSIMETDILNQQNNILLELDKQSIDGTAENGSQVNLTPHERQLVERVVMSESSVEGIEAQMAVAQTIYDRMNDWGDPLHEAIRTYSTKDNGAPTDSVKWAVSNVFDKGERVYDGGTYQFHDDTVSPYWTEGKVARGSIGRLSFYGGYAD